MVIKCLCFDGVKNSENCTFRFRKLYVSFLRLYCYLCEIKQVRMELSIIVAAAENNVIGRENGLIWHLSADLKRFKVLTTGYTILMGRKTFESIGRPLPGRRNVVISRNAAFRPAGVEVAGSPAEAMEKLKEEEKVFVIGGGTIYREFWDKADTLYLTRVGVSPEGDTFIPEILPSQWDLLDREDFEADGKNEYAYSFLDYRRRR